MATSKKASVRLRSLGVPALIAAALLVTIGTGPLRDPSDPEKPVPATFKLAKGGEVVTGDITAWNRAGLFIKAKDGSERRVNWRDMLARQAYDIRRKLMDLKDAMEWLDLGALVLAMDAETLSEQAFAQATKLDEKTKPFVITCQAAKRRGADPQEALNQALLEAQQQELDEKKNAPPAPKAGRPAKGAPKPGTTSTSPKDPAAEIFPIQAPEVPEGERRKEIDEIKAETNKLFTKHGVRLRLTETDRWLFYSTLGEAEVRDWISLIDLGYEYTCALIGLEPTAKVFRGKGVVYLLGGRDDYIEFVRDFFGVDPIDTVSNEIEVSLCTRAGRGYLVGFKESDDNFMRWSFCWQASGAVLHSLGLYTQLPLCMKDGFTRFAGYTAFWDGAEISKVNDWRLARNYAGLKRDPMPFLAMESEPKNAPLDTYAVPVRTMFARYLVDTDGAAFRRWLVDLRNGKPWKSALSEQYHKSCEELARDCMKAVASEPERAPIFKWNR